MKGTVLYVFAVVKKRDEIVAEIMFFGSTKAVDTVKKSLNNFIITLKLNSYCFRNLFGNDCELLFNARSCVWHIADIVLANVDNFFLSLDFSELSI